MLPCQASHANRYRYWRYTVPTSHHPQYPTRGHRGSQLRKYICKKLSLPESQVDEVEILCNGESLGPELNLYFIKCTRWMQGEAHLLLNYRKSRNFR